jgi:hypothetical protein
MTKHWYRPTKKDAYLCDIRSTELKINAKCIMIPIKDCDACEVYHTWKDNRRNNNGKTTR